MRMPKATVHAPSDMGMIVRTVGTAVNPYIEYYADNLAERRLGVFGIWLLLCGFVLQSVQYWMAIFDFPVT
jgi:hypothetical protein